MLFLTLFNFFSVIKRLNLIKLRLNCFCNMLILLLCIRFIGQVWGQIMNFFLVNVSHTSTRSICILYYICYNYKINYFQTSKTAKEHSLKGKMIDIILCRHYQYLFDDSINVWVSKMFCIGNLRSKIGNNQNVYVLILLTYTEF